MDHAELIFSIFAEMIFAFFNSERVLFTSGNEKGTFAKIIDPNLFRSKISWEVTGVGIQYPGQRTQDKTPGQDLVQHSHLSIFRGIYINRLNIRNLEISAEDMS
jgi:hypothetical protein